MSHALITQRIAAELQVAQHQVDAAIGLVDEGATVPFIARYRKEATGGLDDGQLRELEERLAYLRELEERRGTILRTIGEQGQLTGDLEQAVRAAQTKSELEDLYLPYRPRRRTRAQIAREAGLAPLADLLVADPRCHPEQEASGFIDPDRGLADAASALEGARQILMERFAEDAQLLGELRGFLWDHGNLRSRVVDGRQSEGVKFADYFDYAEPIRRIPSHRALALFRGRNEGILTIEIDPGGENGARACESSVTRRFGLVDEGRPADAWLLETAHRAWKVKIRTHLDLELKMRLREDAEAEAIRVFGENLRDLLLAPPAGQRVILGLDPGLRTGVKAAVVDSTGKVAETATVYPHVPHKRWEESLAQLATLVRRHHVAIVATGNGTASRETDLLVRELIDRHPDLGLKRLVVSEAGASVYSASALAASELPGLDVSLRGAVSIARRVQDPLAELVKIDPKAIGVGQYQHDVNQSRLGRKLAAVVEDCVSAVGVNINTASMALLGRVAGLSRTLAENIVEYRDRNGAFRTRQAIRSVPRIGDKTFEQAGGFLRIIGGDNPLDASAVHPEAYPVVERILAREGKGIREVMGNSTLLGGLHAADFTDERFGLPTVRDILSELEKPGLDPRGEFRSAEFTDGVTEIGHLIPGMVLEGSVTNVANFGAFVDIGVHQDGLVHVSALSHRFVRDPREVIRTGQTVKVKVLGVDTARRRISLTMRLDDEVTPVGGADKPPSPVPKRERASNLRTGKKRHPETPGAMARALSAALKKG